MRDQTRNIETFKVGATRVNEFDFRKHHGEMHEHTHDDHERVTDKTETPADRLARLTRQAHEKVLKRKKRR